MGCRKHRCRRWRHDLDLIQTDLDPGGSISLLKYLTRLLFVTMLSSAAVVLTVSVMMLTHCRQQVKGVEDVVMNTQALCTHLTIPAYFVCVIIVVTIFGFGCVGRKVSGLLLIVVSVVALVIAVVVVVTQECVKDVQNVHQALVTKLQQCRFTQGVNSSSNKLHSMQELHRFEYFSDLQLLTACQSTASSLTTLCQQFLAVDPPINDNVFREKQDQSMNETGVERCAREMSHSMYLLCMQDTEIVYPIMLTLPIFYIGIGLALVYIKHADDKAKSILDLRTQTSVGTNTDYSAIPPDSTHSVHHVLCKCISSICVNHSLCFTCLLRGNTCSCCATTSTPLRPSSRQSFQLREVKGVEEEEKEEEDTVISVRILRSTSRPELHEQIRLMEECV